MDEPGRWLITGRSLASVADAQVWTVIALLAAAMFAIVIEIRRMNDRLNDRMTDGFTSVRHEIAGLRTEMQQQFAGVQQQFAGVQQQFTEVRTELAELRHDLRFHTEHDHRPSA